MKVFNIAGARPNFMKIAPIMEAWEKYPDVDAKLIHTGQHYDEKMSNLFFRELCIPKPDTDLEVGSGTHAEQTANVMIRFEKLCIAEKPDLILVVGDVNSTLACSLVGAKLGIPVAHVEAGLRSGDRSMPEEINRIVTDALSDFLFTTSRDADENLTNEGVDPSKIHFVGNVMIDTLRKHRMAALACQTNFPNIFQREFITVTLHRPSNVDNRETLRVIVEALEKIAEEYPILFPIHPRTQKMLQAFGLGGQWQSYSQDKPIKKGIFTLEPQGYLPFLYLTSQSKVVLSDSGGIQEETTALQVPCITLRPNTERPVTITHGTNKLAPLTREGIMETFSEVITNGVPKGRMPEKWDGRAADRICRILAAGKT